MKKLLLIILSFIFIFSNTIFAQIHPTPPRRPNKQGQPYKNIPTNRSKPQSPKNSQPTPPTPPQPQTPKHSQPTPPTPYQPQTPKHSQPTPPPQPQQPLPPPPPPSIKQDFFSKNINMNIGNLPIHGINLSAEAGAMAENSSIEIEPLSMGATFNEIKLNCNNNRFIAVSDLYNIKTKGMNQYSALPITYAIMAKGNVPNGSRLFFLVKLGQEIYFIPAKTTTTYGMAIGEINSCAIYDKIALIADTSYNKNYISNFMISANTDIKSNSSNPYYTDLSEDGFNIVPIIYSKNGKNSYYSSQNLTIIQPQTSTSLNIYKNYNQENIFVQSIPFTTADSYSFCKIDLKNFEINYDNNSLSYLVWFGFENTNIEDIPNALIFRATCYDEDGTCYATEDQLVYIGFHANSYNSPFSGGNGTSSNPYIITNVSQLDKIRDYKRRFFKLNCDIDLSSYQNGNWLALGDNEEPFNGLLDGNNRTIRNLTIQAPNEKYQGLFGCINNGSVKNLRIELSPEGINNESFSGILAGYCSNARITQCYSRGFIKSNNYIGGLVGFCTNNTYIRKSLSSFDINTNIPEMIIGGLVGCAENSVITDCHTSSNITSSGENSIIGGLIGQAEYTKLQNCYSTGKVITGKTGYAGGLVGYMNGCETKGCIAINSRIEGEIQGRIAGNSQNSSFTRCFAWEYIRDNRNKYLSEGGFKGSENSKESRNGESIGKDSFYGSKTRNKFWTVNKKVGFNLNSWVFNSGYNLPQLRGMPSLPNPDYLR